MVSMQWRRQELEVGGTKLGGLEMEFSQQGAGAEPQLGLGVKPPEAEKHVINFVLRSTLVNAYCSLIPHVLSCL